MLACGSYCKTSLYKTNPAVKLIVYCIAKFLYHEENNENISEILDCIVTLTLEYFYLLTDITWLIFARCLLLWA